MTTITDRLAAEAVEHEAVEPTVAPVTRRWWLPLLTGIAWMIVAFAIFRLDYSTVAAVSVLFGCVAIGAGVNEFFLSSLTSGRWRGARILLGVLLTIIGVVALFQPWATFVGLAAAVGLFLIARGTFDLIAALWHGEGLSGSWLLALAGLAELLLGFWAVGSWEVSVVVLVAWVGGIALLRGITEIAAAFQLRQLNKAVEGRV